MVNGFVICKNFFFSFRRQTAAEKNASAHKTYVDGDNVCYVSGNLRERKHRKKRNFSVMSLPMLSHLTDAKYCFEIGDAASNDNPSKTNGLAQRAELAFLQRRPASLEFKFKALFFCQTKTQANSRPNR